jgi:HEAT repeat protein
MLRKTTIVWLCTLLLGACLGAHAAELADLEKALAKVAAYKFGESRAAAVEAEGTIPVLATSPAQRKEIEKRLLALLNADATTTDGKAFACQQLSLVGSAEAVPSLAKLLPEKDLSHMARIALVRIPAPEAAAALRDALGRVQGGLLVGVANSLGDRRDAEAVGPLIKLIGSPDATLAEAALAALGKIGGAEAAKALGAARPGLPAKLRPTALDAYLLCADQLVAQGKKAEAAAIYKEVYDGEKEPHRVAAFRGLLSTGDEAAWNLIIKTLSTDDPKMWGTAAQFAREIPGTEATKALAGQLAKLPAPAQVLLLGALAARGDAAALPAAIQAAKSNEESIRIAALDALGRLGDATTVPLLAGVAASGKAEQAVARRSLTALRGKDVDAAILVAMQGADAVMRAELIRALASRNAVSAAETLLKAAEDADKAVRTEAMNALGALADVKSLPALVKLLANAKDADERGVAERAIGNVCRRVEDKEAAAAPVLAALPGPNAEVRSALLRIVGRIPSAKALDALRAAVKDADAAVKDTAVRALAEWADAAPMPDLLGIAKAAENQVHKVLALRGFVRMAALPSQRAAEETVRLFADAMALAASPDDKKLVLAALAGVEHVGALDLAAKSLSDAAVELEAATAVVQLAKSVRKTSRDAAKAAVQKILEVCKTPAARQVAEAALFVVDSAMNIAPQGVATSPDGLDKDGGAGDDQAAIDGDPATYWDEVDNKPLYRLVVTFKQPEKIAAISILGYEHHQYAPKDFEILCDGKAVKKVENAQYDNNFLVVMLGEVTAKTVELKITGYYGNSPAIRELGIYPPGGKMVPMQTPPPKK